MDHLADKYCILMCGHMPTEVEKRCDRIRVSDDVANLSMEVFNPDVGQL